MAKSTLSTGIGKASNKTGVWKKPYAVFPLSYHPPSGRHYKKIKRFYFGYAKDWQAALEKYQDQRDDRHAGREPQNRSGEVTVRDLLNRLTEKQRQVESGELSLRSWKDY